MKTLFLALALVLGFAAPSIARRISVHAPGRVQPLSREGSLPSSLAQELRALSMRGARIFGVGAAGGGRAFAASRSGTLAQGIC